MVDKEQKIKLRNTMLNIACEVFRVCESLGIKCFIVSGTALGAVRHKGFIPWDSDLDIALKRKDYEIFLENANRLLSSEYVCWSYKNKRNFYSPHALVVSNNSLIIWNKTYYTNKTNMPVYVDVFPLDAMPTERKRKEAQQKKVFKYIRLLSRKECLIYGHNSFLVKCGKKVTSFILKVFYPNNRINILLDREMKKYDNGIYQDFGIMPSRYGFERETINDEIIGIPKKYQFESTFFYGYEKIDQYLRKLYGNYLEFPPVNERNENFDHIDHFEFM